MESITLPSSLQLIWHLRRSIEKNQSIHVGIQGFIEQMNSGPSHLKPCAFSKNFVLWWAQAQAKNEFSPNTIELNKAFNFYQRSLIYLIMRGLSGTSIYENLKNIELEFVSSCEDDIQSHVLNLPLLLQIPLLFLIFPSIMVILIVPAMALFQI